MWTNQLYGRKESFSNPVVRNVCRIDNVVISEAVPVCNYIIRKSQNKDLLGKTLKDFSIINMYCWSIDNLGLALVKLCWMPGK